MALFLSPWRCWWNGSDHDFSDASAETPDLAAVVEVGDGSWARTYRHSTSGEQKEALELLFRTRIISVHEFAHSHASQEHIEECVWIATQMLRQKPLEEWVVWRQQALQSFEDSITAIFAARTTKGYGKEELPWNSRAKVEDVEAPPTPPLQ